MTRPLDEREIETAARALAEQGWTSVRDVVPQTLLTSLSESIEPLARSGRMPAHVAPDGSVSSAHELCEALPEYRAFVLETPLRRIAERLFGTALSSRILDASYFPKAPRTGRATELHQDNAFLLLDPPEGVVCWFPLDDVGEDDAPVVYAPGTHRLGVLSHAPVGLGKLAIDEAGLARLASWPMVAVPCRAGDCLMHLCETVHGSRPNVGEKQRQGVNFTLATERSLQGEKRQRFSVPG